MESGRGKGERVDEKSSMGEKAHASEPTQQRGRDKVCDKSDMPYIRGPRGWNLKLGVNSVPAKTTRPSGGQRSYRGLLPQAFHEFSCMSHDYWSL